MRFSTFVIVVAVCCLPAVALAVGPRQAAKKSKSTPVARPSVSYGTPSLSPAAQQALDQRRAAEAYRRTARASGSMAPAATEYHYGSGAAASRPLPGRSFTDRVMSSKLSNRPAVVINRPDINVVQSTINRSITNINNTTINNVQINNYQRPRDYYRQPQDYYQQLHYHWSPSSWQGSYRPAYGSYSYSSTSGGLLSVGSTQYAYVNPFYVRPARVVGYRFDYSQPLHVPAPDYRETTADLVRSERAVRRFDDARELFRRGEYGRANDLIDEAIELLPSDPALHQFRALVLFAREQYQESAATLYSVLAVSPGWDTATVAKLYDPPRRYLEQVAELERYVAANPTAMDSRFLLAYHCVLKGDLATAERLLESVRIANPNDRVVQNLLVALRA